MISKTKIKIAPYWNTVKITFITDLASNKISLLKSTKFIIKKSNDIPTTNSWNSIEKKENKTLSPPTLKKYNR